MNNTSYLNEILKSRTLNDFQKTALQTVIRFLLKQTFADRENCILDIFNEAFIKISQTKTFDSSRPVAPWAYKVAYTVMNDYFNKENKYHSHFVDLCPRDCDDDCQSEEVVDNISYIMNSSACPIDYDSWEAQTIREETMADFCKHVENLSDIDRRIIDLKESGMRCKEIAEQLQLSRNAVEMRSFRMRKSLEQFRPVA